MSIILTGVSYRKGLAYIWRREGAGYTLRACLIWTLSLKGPCLLRPEDLYCGL